MFWKRKKKEGVREVTPLFLTKAAIRLNKQLLMWAEYLQQRTIKCSPKRLKLLLGIFCHTYLACSVSIIITSLGEKSLPFRITPIQAVPLVKRTIQGPVITEKEYLRFHRLRHSLDSLAATPSGKLRLDSILQKHPRLLDTLSLLESIYYNQHKNESDERSTNKS
jgi:hypothetical protein